MRPLLPWRLAVIQAATNDSGGDHAEDGAHPPPATPEQRQRPHEDQRERQVELLLDGQRPEVLDGSLEDEGGGVVAARVGEAPVGHVAERAEQVAPEAGARARPRRSAAGRRCRRSATIAAGSRRRARRSQNDASRSRRCATARRGRASDQEPGEGEEHRHREDAAPRRRVAVVVRQDRQQPEGPQPVEAGDVAEAHPGQRRRDRRAGRRPTRAGRLAGRVPRTVPPGDARRGRASPTAETGCVVVTDRSLPPRCRPRRPVRPPAPRPRRGRPRPPGE